MAEKATELVAREDKITQAKELYARGYRNYVVGDFNEAAEDLSRSCELYAELFGDESEEVNRFKNFSKSVLIQPKFVLLNKVAVPNLFYGKTLIELAQLGENKLLVLPEQEEEEDEDSNDNGDADDNKVKPGECFFFLKINQIRTFESKIFECGIQKFKLKCDLCR